MRLRSGSGAVALTERIFRGGVMAERLPLPPPVDFSACLPIYAASRGRTACALAPVTARPNSIYRSLQMCVENGKPPWRACVRLRIKE
jgi:hypothetical protein